MRRRAQSATETRQRIVEATAALHAERGVAATTFRDISARADVGLGTVYHHFPTYDDVITACGSHTLAVARPPQAQIFESIEHPDERVRVLVRELFAFYQRLPSMGRVRAERHRFVPLEKAFEHEEENRRALVAAALRGTRASSRLRALAFSIVDFSVYESLRACSVEHDAAVDEITNLLLTRLHSKRRKP